MQNQLKKYFPLIREKEEVLNEITQSARLTEMFYGWREEQQTEFLDFCTGARGIKILYDSFFKEVMNPEYDSQRLDAFLSELLKQQVKILHVLPNDSVRIAAESSLLITDLVVQLEDGSIANIEIQKIGYMFCGERASCYSADLLLRQYKRVRDKKKKQFNYKDIKPVYTIVLFEQSPREFQKFPNTYLHYIEAKSDSGISLNLLQKYLFIPLDIFKKNHHNKGVSNSTDAWLAFLCMDRPEDIIQLIAAYPEFKAMYDDLYQLCLNTEKVMEMFSKELEILDKNTVQYMMDEMQDTINEMKEQITEKDITIAEKDITIEMLQKRIKELEQK